MPPLAPIATTATPRRRGPGTAPEGVCVREGLGTMLARHLKGLNGGV